jgi:anaerobic carbon-monoxide dehydrogenase iron sulfur subunit
MKKLVLEISKCTGCGQCALTCAFNKYDAFDIKRSNIKVVQWEDICLSVPMVCQQCGDAQCIEICPTDALSWDSNLHTIQLDKAVCINCEACIHECTYQVMHLDEDDFPATCDHCLGDPQCVKACYPGALSYVEVSDDVPEQFREFVVTLVDRAKGKNVPPPAWLKKMGNLQL